MLYVLGVQHSVSQFLKVSYDKPTQHIKKAETKNQKLFFFFAETLPTKVHTPPVSRFFFKTIQCNVWCLKQQTPTLLKNE